MAARWSAWVAVGVMLPALHGCTFDPSGFGSGWPDAEPADRALDDGRPVDAPLDARSEDTALRADAGPDTRTDACLDATPEDAGLHVDAALDARADAAVDAAKADGGPGPCAGTPVEGYCWYASAPDESCTAACATHGGCNLAGTRDYAGSGGSDANCVRVLIALGYGGYRHQDFSNNDLGCHFAWPGDPWTYWSTAYPTTCDAAYPGQAHARRMCACND